MWYCDVTSRFSPEGCVVLASHALFHLLWMLVTEQGTWSQQRPTLRENSEVTEWSLESVMRPLVKHPGHVSFSLCLHYASASGFHNRKGLHIHLPHPLSLRQQQDTHKWLLTWSPVTNISRQTDREALQKFVLSSPYSPQVPNRWAGRGLVQMSMG